MRLHVRDLARRQLDELLGGARGGQPSQESGKAGAPREEPDADEREQAGQQSSGAHRQASASGQARPAAQPAQGAAPSAQLLAW